MIYWIVIERDPYDTDMQDIAYGPYPSKEAAEFAEENAPLIEFQCHENCLDIAIEETHPEDCPKDCEIVLININNPYHTGLESVAG